MPGAYISGSQSAGKVHKLLLTTEVKIFADSIKYLATAIEITTHSFVLLIFILIAMILQSFVCIGRSHKRL